MFQLIQKLGQKLGRKVGLALIASVLFTPIATAQQSRNTEDYVDIDLGERETGLTYPIGLAAKNLNCSQLLDFRFTSKTPWLRMPDDPVARQVPAGEVRQIDATLDFTNVTPGLHQGYVDVDCENCGFFIFKNCKINKQQLRFHVQVNAAPAPQPAPPQGGPQLNPAPPQDAAPDGPPDGPLLNPLRPSKVDDKDKRIPRRLRNKAKAAHTVWALALKNSNKCKEELAALKTAADAAKEAADKAAMAADTAEQDLRNVKAEKNAAQTELLNANIEMRDARDAVKKAKSELRQANRNGTSDDRQDAKDALAAAEAAKTAAEKRLEDAAQSVRLHSPKDVADHERNAKAKRRAAEKAAKAATKAQKALTDKQKECLALQQKAAEAQAANEKAEKDANDSIPPPPPGPNADDVDAQRKKVQQCSTKLGQLLEAQRLALEAMAKLGALGDDYESDLDDWANGVDAANDLFDRVPPGIPIVSEMVGTAQTALTYIRNALGVAKGVKALGNTVHTPKNGNGTKNPSMTKDWIKDNVLGDHYQDEKSKNEEANRVYEQMIKYSSTDSTKKMQEELAYQKKLCKAEEDKLDAVKKAVEGE